MRSILHRGKKFQPLTANDERSDKQIPDNLWRKCPGCGDLVYSVELENNMSVCPKCDYHFRLSARARIDQLLDPDTFEEWDSEVFPTDPLEFFDGSGSYADKLEKTQTKTGEHEALITGHGTVEGRRIVIAVADFAFMGASMGSVFGEKVTRAAERCAREGDPLLTINASGGARMHEGLFSLMQMAKTVAAFSRMGEARVPHLSLLVDPCYGGVTASYATVADIIMAEPGALIGFAGPRVIEQITKQKLPEGFQTSEFLLDHGMVDFIVSRPDLRSRLTVLLDHFANAHVVDRGESIPWEPSILQSATGNGSKPREVSVVGSGVS